MPIRTRVTVLATALMAIVLLVSSAAIVSVQRRQLTDNLDASIGQRVDQIRAQLDSASSVPPLGDGVGTERFAQVVVGGEVVGSTANVIGFGPMATEPSIATVDDLPIEDDSYRVQASAAEVDGAAALIVVGENTDDVDDALRALAIAMLAIVPLATAVLGSMVWWLVGRTLRPVEALRAEVADIGAGDLGRRVSLPAVRDEIHDLGVTMNSMLERLEASSELQRQFVSDASHELRSPLTRLRTELEVALRQEEGADFEATARSSLSEVVSMQGLVEDLLDMARLDEARGRRAFQPVDLGELARAFERLDPSIRVEVGVPTPIVDGDPRQLQRLLTNLVDNAKRHSRSAVRLGAHATSGGVELVVEDDGDGIPNDQRSLVFERFTRADEARSAEHGGAGLGLAIARGIVELHGGEIAVGDSDLGGAQLLVRLPGV